MTPKVTVIAWVEKPTFDQVRYLVESFLSQTYPNKELLVANRSDWQPIKNLPGSQFKLPWDTNTATTMSELVRQAQGEYCVVWKMGHWYHPQVLALHMGHTDPYADTQVVLNSEIVSQGFYRRAYHLVTGGKSKVTTVGGIGLARKIGEAEMTGPKYFYHSGNLGDIIYGLPAMKMLGGGFLMIGPDVRLKTADIIPFREHMSRRLFNTIAPLLRRQPYVRQTYFYNFMPKVDYDMNSFRMVEWVDQNLAEMTLQGIGMSGKMFLGHADPWLDVPEPVFGKPVLIHRSARYHNLKFPWRKVLTKYHGQIEFVGFPLEHSQFCKEFGVDIPFHKSEDLLALARRIAGARLFIGNQSCPCAIAEGLKVSLVQEVDKKIANCKFNRDGAIYCDDEHVYLPDLESLPEKKPEKKRKWWSFTRKPKDQAKTFYHSGDIGDIIYALHVVKEMGGGHVVLGPNMADVLGAVKPRTVFNHALFGLLDPLVKCQSFIKSVRYAESKPEGSLDLNHFRHVEWQRTNGFKYKSIVEMTRESASLEPEFDTSVPWLSIPDPIFAADVIIHRSPRFSGSGFPWEAVVEKYGKSSLFVGLKEEHRDFVDKFGWVPYLPTTDLLVLGRVIAGCQLFIGNQSSPYAIAEGLKKATIQEMSVDCPNCVFTRPNAVFGSDEFTPLPDISFNFAENTEAWNENLVSFFTTCKNRVEHIKQTLPKNLAHHKDDPNVEFVVLDYSSDDGLAEWVKTSMMEHVKSGKLVYFRANGYTKFQMSHSKNCAARLTRGAIICNMDSDNETGAGFAEWLRRAVKEGRWAGTESFTDDFGGRQAFRRKDFYDMSGFDEQMIGWGSDDYDISRRAKALGLKCAEVPAIYKYSLSHSNELRGRYMEITDRDATNKMNMDRCNKTHAAGTIRVNPGRWGAIIVERNFEGRITAI